MTDKETDKKKEKSEEKTFTIPNALEVIKEKITITTNNPSKPSKEKLINQAFKFHSQGNLIEAEKYYKYFIKQGFSDPRMFSNYGTICQSQGKLSEAEILFRKAIHSKPDFFSAYCNLGGLLKDQEKLIEAEFHLKKAIEIKPDLAEALYNLGILYNSLGKLAEAELYLRKSIKFKPKSKKANYNLAGIYRARGKLKEAEILTKKIINMFPNYTDSYCFLGLLLKDLGREKESNIYFSKALQKKPNSIYLYINSNLVFSPIMMDNLQIDNERKNYLENIINLKKNKNLYLNENEVFATDMFYLAYQNRLDDKNILEELSETISKAKGVLFNNFSREEYLLSSSKREKLKLGICSEFLREDHTIGKLYINLLLDLLKTDLEISIYIPPTTAKTSGLEIIRKSFKRVINLPTSTYKASQLILSDELDILFYPDIGMSCYTYILALSRLAIVQVTSLGHPNTTGIKNIDYFISNNIFPHKPSSSYSEKLVKLSRLPFNYPIPKINESNLTKNRIINLQDKFRIGLTQSLFKLHPDYDEILESILLEIENANLILINDSLDKSTKALKKRWEKRNKILLKKSIFLDRMSSDNFINLTKNCHIMLDPFYFGSGNTFYEAMAFGIPFITYPFNQRGSLVASGYKQMQVKQPPIANSPEEYINWCKKYASDQSLLRNTKNELRYKATNYLFNDNEIYKEYYAFFCEAIKKAKTGEVLDENWQPNLETNK